MEEQSSQSGALERLVKRMYDAGRRRAAEENFTELKVSKIANHAVVLVSGIRDTGEWHERVSSILHKEGRGTIDCYSHRPGGSYYDLIRFLVPGFKRRAIQNLRDDFEALFQNKKFTKVSVIAHSFGTFLTTECAKEFTFHKVILCGSIVRQDFDWKQIEFNDAYSQVDEQNVVNDCGSLDRWPLVAQFVSRRFGFSGRFGFYNPLVRDRFHRRSHGGFFDETFVERYWAPFLINGEINLSAESSSPLWLEELTTIPYLKYIALVLLVALGWLGLSYWWLSD